MNTSHISRRDITLMAAGLGLLVIGSIADSAINHVGAADTASLTAAVDRLQAVPSVIGDWTSVDTELSEREVQVAEIDGYIRREYRHRKTGYKVFLTILAGPSGPMAVHPPTACFEGVGYTLLTGPTPTSAEARVDAEDVRFDFNKCTFRQGGTDVAELARVYWGWGDGHEWTAPSNPRLSFRDRSWLYKIYIVDRWLEDTGRQSLPQIETFMEDALPTIAAILRADTNDN